MLMGINLNAVQIFWAVKFISLRQFAGRVSNVLIPSRILFQEKYARSKNYENTKILASGIPCQKKCRTIFHGLLLVIYLAILNAELCRASFQAFLEHRYLPNLYWVIWLCLMLKHLKFWYFWRNVHNVIIKELYFIFNFHQTSL